MEMVKQLDAGPVYVQQAMTLNGQETTPVLVKELLDLTLKLLDQYLIPIIEKKITARPQNHLLATYTAPITRADEKINWHQSTQQINAQIRAFYPKPLAFTTTTNHQQFKVHQAEVADVKVESKSTTPGTIMAVNSQGMFVQTHDGLLKILILQKAGKKPQPASTFQNLKHQQFI